MKSDNLLVLGLVLTLAAVGCKKQPVGVTEMPGSRAGHVGDPGRMSPLDTQGGTPVAGETEPIKRDLSSGVPPNEAGNHEGWIEHPDILQVDTVYFDFDSAVVKGSEKAKVSAVADYLKANPASAVRVEGNCDERGTEEYNRALGDRRALAVREELVALGILPTTVDTITYGKDRPADPGHDATAWSKNRRDDFVVLTQPVKP